MRRSNIAPLHTSSPATGKVFQQLLAGALRITMVTDRRYRELNELQGRDMIHHSAPQLLIREATVAGSHVVLQMAHLAGGGYGAGHRLVPQNPF